MNELKKEFEQSQANLLQTTLDLVNEKPCLTNQQLLTLLSQRLATGEIKRELTQFGYYLITETQSGIFKVDLADGQLTPDLNKPNSREKYRQDLIQHVNQHYFIKQKNEHWEVSCWLGKEPAGQLFTVKQLKEQNLNDSLTQLANDMGEFLFTKKGEQIIRKEANNA